MIELIYNNINELEINQYPFRTRWHSKCTDRPQVCGSRHLHSSGKRTALFGAPNWPKTLMGVGWRLLRCS